MHRTLILELNSRYPKNILIYLFAFLARLAHDRRRDARSSCAVQQSIQPSPLVHRIRRAESRLKHLLCTAPHVKLESLWNARGKTCSRYVCTMHDAYRGGPARRKSLANLSDDREARWLLKLCKARCNHPLAARTEARDSELFFQFALLSTVV